MTELNTTDYYKGLDIIRKRQEYNKKYYQNRKQQQRENKDNETKKQTGRKPKEITPQYVEYTLTKYKAKIKNEMTEEQIKNKINKLIHKLKEMRQ